VGRNCLGQRVEPTAQRFDWDHVGRRRDDHDRAPFRHNDRLA